MAKGFPTRMSELAFRAARLPESRTPVVEIGLRERRPCDSPLLLAFALSLRCISAISSRAITRSHFMRTASHCPALCGPLRRSMSSDQLVQDLGVGNQTLCAVEF